MVAFPSPPWYFYQERLKAAESKAESKDFLRGNSDQNDKSISPKKKGRGRNKIPPSGSLVPVVQKKRDKLGRIVEYPKVEGVRVERELAFDYPRQFNWQYCYSIQDEDGCWHTKKVNVAPEKVRDVRNAIAASRPISEILQIIRRSSIV
jgi:hypothetical protein